VKVVVAPPMPIVNLIGVAVEVAYVCIQPRITVDVAAFVVVTVTVPPSVDAPVIVCAPTTVEDACEREPPAIVVMTPDLPIVIAVAVVVPMLRVPAARTSIL